MPLSTAPTRPYTRVQVVGPAHLDHELHDPAAEGDLGADVGEEEAWPRDASVGAFEERGAHAAATAAMGEAHRLAVRDADLLPEVGGAPHQFNEGYSELHRSASSFPPRLSLSFSAEQTHQDVADEGGEKHEGYDDAAEAAVRFELAWGVSVSWSWRTRGGKRVYVGNESL